uniref:Integrin alpha-5-like n=1 Tax=Gouania willdenowi TaxID=441366 RepID=A0A8C5GIB3_GOUWI
YLLQIQSSQPGAGLQFCFWCPLTAFWSCLWTGVFYIDNDISILIGAPKGNTTQPNIIEGGAVYLCSWNQTGCSIINFDQHGNRYFYINDINTQVEFKSHQWFGATVRSNGNSTLACAPRYYWRTEHDTPFADLTGTCYLSVDGLKTFVEYAPCRTERHGPAGQGYCQGGFSVDFTKVRHLFVEPSLYLLCQLISATTEEIVKAYYPSYFLLAVSGQIQTRQVQGSYDDSYLGEGSVVRGATNKINPVDKNERKRKGSLSVGVITGSLALVYDAFQMGSYFVSVIIASLDDLVVGAPMFMLRGSNGRLEELGKVYIYLQKGPLLLELCKSNLLGPQAFSRFGSSLAPLGDLNQDGFNDMAIGCPYGGEDNQGLVYIFNGHVDGLMDTPTQSLSGQWASSTFPASFGFALRGNTDLDQNGYPDLMVGAFGADKAVLYRARPIVSAVTSLTVKPTMFNQEEKTCLLIGHGSLVYINIYTIYILHFPGFVVEVQLDSVKQNQRESIRRTLFVESQQPSMVKSFQLSKGERLCHEENIYLRADEEFRDKLSPIYISLNFSLDPQASLDQYGLSPILDYQTKQHLQQKAQIQLDCGEDNICVPDLKLAVYGTEIYLGDENYLSLTFNARNEGEGGAYEAGLYVALPAEADYSGIARSNASLTQLTCSYEAENLTRYLVCDLGNPMKSGTSLWAGLRFTVPRLKDTYKTLQIGFQIRSKNVNNSESEVVQFELKVAAMATVIMQGVSRPDKFIFPPPNWKVHHSLGQEQDVGPELQHVHELVNNGPSVLSHSTFEVKCPLKAHGQELLYPVEVVTQGPISCSSKTTLNALKLKVKTHKSNTEHHIQRREVDRDHLADHFNLTCIGAVECWQVHCDVGLLEKGGRSKKVLTTLMWNKPDSHLWVPVWIIILAVLVGLLLLALLIYLLYKLGFFKRSDPYGTTMEKAELKPQASSEA